MTPIDHTRISLKSFELARKLYKRHTAEKRFRLYGVVSVFIPLCFMALLVITLIYQGWSSFVRTEISLPLKLTPETSLGALESYNTVLLAALHTELNIPSEDKSQDPDLLNLLSADSVKTVHLLITAPHQVPRDERGNVWVKATRDVDKWVKFLRFKSKKSSPPLLRYLKPEHFNWIAHLDSVKKIRIRFNSNFFLHGDSQEPEIAGVYSALIGSLFTLGIALLFAFPIGLSSALYLEEFAPRGKFFDFLEVNINNLAAVPAIIFGLLGLAIFCHAFGIPRSASLAGGLTLALIILPIIVISSRTALKTVPMSIRQAAQALGASQAQTVFHHVLPLAFPGILTGTLLGLLRAMGESAPLLMLGMIAFIADAPSNIYDPATVLPVQIYSWAKNPSRGFIENTSAATLLLLLFLLILNSLIIYLRRKFERKW